MDNILPNDPLFSQQWHLNNIGQSGGTVGEDINVLDAWKIATGEGVVIGIVDGAVQFSHPDLDSQDLAGLNQDFTSDNSVPNFSNNDIQERRAELRELNREIAEESSNRASDLRNELNEIRDRLFDDALGRPTDIHGTPVAGIAIASNDDVGTVGVAYDASFAGLRIQIEDDEVDPDLLDAQFAAALSHRNQDIDIYNNSWETTPLASLQDTKEAIETGITVGRNGLGNIYVFAAGNDGLNGGNVNYSSLTNSRYTIAVGAIDHNGLHSVYSNPGASLLVSAYANADDLQGLTTTDLRGEEGYSNISGYTNFPGTSAATPIVSGVVALMLEVNPDLTWRDVQHILVESAVINDPDNLDWRENGAGYLVNHNYGFGTVDAEAAVTLARDWENVDEEISESSEVINVNRNIPDDTPNGITSTVEIEEDINLEWVEIITDADLIKDDLTLILTSPDGTRSELSTDSFTTNATGNWTFTSVRHWGESSAGEWSLRVIDNQESDQTTRWDSWQLKLYGTDEGENNNREIIAANNSNIQSRIESATENIDRRISEAFNELFSSSEENETDETDVTDIENNTNNNLSEQFPTIFPGFGSVGFSGVGGTGAGNNLDPNARNIPAAPNNIFDGVGENFSDLRSPALRSLIVPRTPTTPITPGGIGAIPNSLNALDPPSTAREQFNDLVSQLQGNPTSSEGVGANDSNSDSFNTIFDNIRDQTLDNQTAIRQSTRAIIDSIDIEDDSQTFSSNSLFISEGLLFIPNAETNASIRAIADDAPIIEIETEAEFNSLDLEEGEVVSIQGTVITASTASIDTGGITDLSGFDLADFGIDVSADAEIINLDVREPNSSSVEGAVYSVVDEEQNFQLYTTDEDELDRILTTSPQYSDEGIAFIAAPNDDDISGVSPVYHLTNPRTGANIYTISDAEREEAESSNYDFEGISFYAYDRRGEDRIPLYDVFNEDLNTHFYTLSRSERDELLDDSDFEFDVAFYVEAAPEI